MVTSAALLSGCAASRSETDLITSTAEPLFSCPDIGHASESREHEHSTSPSLRDEQNKTPGNFSNDLKEKEVAVSSKPYHLRGIALKKVRNVNVIKHDIHNISSLICQNRVHVVGTKHSANRRVALLTRPFAVLHSQRVHERRKHPIFLREKNRNWIVRGGGVKKQFVNVHGVFQTG